jgi:small conductance mechanosensitive channel
MILVIFREVGLEIELILASAGILRLAVGFGAQNLVRNFIAGIFMILENQIQVSDVVMMQSN